ncbi:MAG TPA: TRAP transporter large permease subunit [Acetobacteraceae bacterium]|nr:TRAP transporter large permease subunit [Acetobacteraceae bacterium]
MSRGSAHAHLQGAPPPGPPPGPGALDPQTFAHAAPALIARLEKALALITELPAAALVIAEVAILFTGVIFRYALDRPLVWTDELASALFLWLVMLGAVIALRRGHHMRLSALSRWLSPTWQARLDSLAAMFVALFVIEIIAPAANYTITQWAIITPTLQMHDSYRVAAILVGTVLMLATSALRILRTSDPREAAISLAVIAVLGVALWAASPWLEAIGNYNLAIFFGLIVAALVAIGCPIAFGFGVATMSYLTLVTSVPTSIVVMRMDEGMSSLILLAVPLFVFLGLLIEMTGLARVLVTLMAALVGHLRGGLSYVLLGAMYLVSGISGSKAADMAAVVPVLFPEMRRRGMQDGDLIGLLSTAGAMAETIPPSIVLITIGAVTGVSIAGLFAAGLLPAFIGALALAFVAFLRARGNVGRELRRASLREVLRAFIAALPALVLPLLIRWAVVAGVATATEVSTIGIVYTVLIALLIYRRFDWHRLLPVLVETASLSGAILMILGTATAMAWALTQSGFAGTLADTMAHVPGHAVGFMAISVVVFVMLGCILEGIPAIVLFGPLLFPIAGELHIDLVHYAIVVVLAMGLGLFMPPLGVGFYTACAIGGVPPEKAMRACWPYIAALFGALLLVAFFPALSTGHF